MGTSEAGLSTPVQGFYYIEGHTWIEQCSGRVYASGVFVLEYRFTKSIGP